MSYETFDWCCDKDPEGEERYRTLGVKFGDGYAQTVGDGINNAVQSWPLKFSGFESKVLSIRDFLRRHAGYRPFLWSPPLDGPKLFTATGLKLVPKGGGYYELTVTFEQFFAP